MHKPTEVLWHWKPLYPSYGDQGGRNSGAKRVQQSQLAPKLAALSLHAEKNFRF